MKRMQRWAALVLTAAMVVTGIQTPVWAATDEGAVIAEVAEEGVGTETVVEPEAPVGKDEYDAHVYSEDDFVTALNGKAKSIMIEEDFDLTKSYTIAENTDIQMAGHVIGADYEGKNPTKASEAISLTIAADKTVNISCDEDRYECNRGGIVSLINNGTLTIEDTDITNNYGPAIINNGTLTTEYTEIYGNCVASEDLDIDAAVVNNKSYLMSKGTYVEEGNLSGIKNNSGASLVMEAGEVEVTDNNASSGVSNNGVFVQRGGYIKQNYGGYGMGVVNTGTFTMQDGFIWNTYVGVVTYDGGQFEMTGSGAQVLPYEIGVATNAQVDTTISENLNNSKSGSFCMMGGYFGFLNSSKTTRYAVAYTDSSPKLLGGKVFADKASVAKFENGVFQTLEGIYENNDDKAVSATYVKDGRRYDSVGIVGGLVVDMSYIKYEPEYASGNKVTSFTQLKEAVNGASTDAGKPSYIYVSGNLVISESLAIPAQKQIIICDDPKCDVNKITINPDVQLIVESGANLKLKLCTEASVSGNAPLVNKGKLSVEREVKVSSNRASSKQTAAVENNGTLFMDGDITSLDSRILGILNNSSGTVNILAGGNVEGSTAISNNGICNVDNGYINGNDSNGYGVYNTGTFNMDNGKGIIFSPGIGIYQASGTVKLTYMKEVEGDLFGIAYEGSNLPEIEIGIVSGGTYAVAIADKTKPMSEWAAGKYKTIFSLDTETDSKGACVIENGVPCAYTNGLYFATKYLQMEQGEELVFVEDLLNAPNRVDNNIGYDKVTFTSTNDNVIKLSTVSEGDAKYPHPGKKTDRTVAVAGTQKGYAVIKMTTAGGVEDFMRIEVTDKKKADVTLDDFEGHLLDSNIGINGYRKENTINFGFNLKANKDDIYVQSTVDDLKETTWTPDDIIIHDSEFCDYYTVDNCYANDTESESYSFQIEPKLEYGIPKVINDDVQSIKDIDVYMTMVSGNGVPVKGMIKIGTMNLSISDVQPEIKFRPVTLEGAFDTESDLNYINIFNKDLVYSPQLSSEDLHGQVIDYSAAKGLNIDEFNYLVYSGPVKKLSTKVPVTCELDHYYGKYPSEVAVNVIATKPKAELVTSSFPIAKEYAKSDNISLSLKSKYKPSLTELKNAEIVGDSNFVISRTDFDDSRITKRKKTYQLNNAITLAPKADVKAGTITIKLTYDHVKAVKGKEYVTYLKVKVSTPKKFSIKPIIKKQALDPTCYVDDDGKCLYDKVTFKFKKTPSNYTGASFVVTDLDGLELSGLPNSATGKFTVRANSNTDTSKAKVITVKWVDNTTHSPIAATKVKVVFNKKQSMELKTKKLTMDIGKPARYFGDFENLTYYYCRRDILHTYVGSSRTQFCDEATLDQMKVPLKLKESGTLAHTGSISVQDARFEVGLWRATQTGKKVWSPYIQPTMQALENNKLVPNCDYATLITREDKFGNKYTEMITIHIAGYSVKPQLKSKEVTLYKKTPYYEATIGVKPISPAFERIVSITSNDPDYSVRRAKSTNDDVGYGKDDYTEYQVFYTNHSSKKIKDTKKPVKVKLTITYASRKTSTEEIKITNVNVKQ